jgi:hypothetical protein
LATQTKTETVELAGGLKLHIETVSMFPTECQVALTFDADLVPVHLELLQFAGKDPAHPYDVLMLAMLPEHREPTKGGE